MLGFLMDTLKQARSSEHRFRLFACACVRRVEGLLADRRSRAALDVAERYALGKTDHRALEHARNAARDASLTIWQRSLENGGALADTVCAAQAALDVTTQPGRMAAWQVCQALFPTLLADWSPQAADLIRDVFGNPFQVPSLPPYWRIWNEGTIVRLARHIHEGQRHDELPILADALEEAGCTDEGILNHCRFAPVHVPGCWVLELLVGDDFTAG
jgi:hypothetical protein